MVKLKRTSIYIANSLIGTNFASNSYLLESDVISVLSETLTAHVETVLANESMSVGTDAAKKVFF